MSSVEHKKMHKNPARKNRMLNVRGNSRSYVRGLLAIRAELEGLPIHETSRISKEKGDLPKNYYKDES